MNALQQDYDFESIHRAVCPPVGTLTLGQRFNRAWPSPCDMITFLSLLNDVEFIESKTTTTPVGPAYWQAMNNTLLGSPEKKWANGSAYVSHRLTAKGRAYLCWLKVVTHKPTPRADREVLRRYERRFSTSARWVAALHPPLTTHQALDVLYAEYNAHKMDARALMAGAI